MLAAQNLIIALLWLVWSPIVLMSEAPYEETFNSYQPGQPIQILVNTLNKVFSAPPSKPNEPERMHFLPAPAFNTWLPINDQWEINPNHLPDTISETQQ